MDSKAVRVMMAALAAALIAWGLCGCEDDSRTTVNEAPEISVPTNGTTTITSVDVNGNANSTIVYVETSPGVIQVIDIDVHGNSNVVGVIYKQPAIPVAPETGPPEGE